MLLFTRFWERMAIRILLRSDKITMLAFKDRDVSHIFMAAAPTDRGAWEFMARNRDDIELEPDSMALERLYHMPDVDHSSDAETNT